MQPNDFLTPTLLSYNEAIIFACCNEIFENDKCNEHVQDVEIALKQNCLYDACLYTSIQKYDM